MGNRFGKAPIIDPSADPRTTVLPQRTRCCRPKLSSDDYD